MEASPTTPCVGCSLASEPDQIANGKLEQKSEVETSPSKKDGYYYLWNGEAFVGLVLGISTFALSMVVDALKKEKLFPSTPIYLTTFFALVIASPLTHLAGRHKFLGTYELWQPFIGGNKFVLFQAFGWFFYTLGLMFSLMFLSNGVESGNLINGVLTATGALGFLSQLMISLSLQNFDEEGVKKAKIRLEGDKFKISFKNSPSSLLADQKERIQDDLKVSYLLSILATLTFLVIDFKKRESPVSPFLYPFLSFASLALLIAPPLTHFMGKRGIQEYSLWQPFVGGTSFLLLQSFGWFFYALTVSFTIICLNNSIERLSFDGLISIVGCLGLASQIMIGVSLPFFEEPGSQTRKKDVCEKEGKNEAKVALAFWKNPESLLAQFLSFPSVFIFLFVDLTKNDSDWIPVDKVVLCVATTALFISSPLIYCFGGGRRQYKTFTLWQPFAGGNTFVLLQGIGWAIYSVFVMIMMIFLWIGIEAVQVEGLISFTGFLGFAAEILILLSLPFFEEKENNPVVSMKGAIELKHSGETLLSFFLAIGSLALFIIVDLTRGYGKVVDFPSHLLTMFGILGFFISVPMAHVAGRRMYQDYKIWQPFLGGTKYISYQASGWTLYALFLQFSLILLSNNITKMTSFSLIFTFVGSLGFISQFLMFTSLSYFEQKCSYSLVSSPPPQSSPSSQTHDNFVGLILSCVSLALFHVIDIMKGNENFQPLLSVTVMSALASFTVSSPITHFFGGYQKYKLFSFWQPFLGGTRFVLLQSIAWTLYAVTIMFTLACIYKGFETIDVNGLVTAIGAMGFSSQMLILVSLQYFDELEVLKVKGITTSDVVKSTDGKSTPGDHSTASHSNHAHHPKSSPVLVFCCKNSEIFVSSFLALGSFLLFLVVDFMVKWYGPAFPSLPFILVATIAFCIAVPMANCWGGKRKYQSYFSNWQPFIGGKKFVWLQAFAWTAYTCSLILSFVCVYYNLKRIPLMGGLLPSTGAGGFLSQLLVFLSLEYFDGRIINKSSSHGCHGKKKGASCSCSSKIQSSPAPASGTPAGLGSQMLLITLDELKCFANQITTFLWGLTGGRTLILPDCVQDFVDFTTTNVLYQLHFIVWWTWMFILGTWGVDGLLFLLSIGLPYIFLTYRDTHQTGKRRWNWVRNQSWFWDSLQRYFSFQIIPEGHLSADQQYIFGYHPHGIVPWTAGWSTMTSTWKQLYPGVETEFLGASIIFSIPVMRDLAMWVGGRDVSRKSFNLALQSKKSVLLVPGGQSEMREHTFDPSETVLYTRHRGFVALAIQHGTPLVPIFSFGENQMLNNLRFPKAQAFFTRILGFGLLVFPYGRWFLPIPYPHPIRLVVGEPIPVTKNPHPHKDEVEKVHTQYYQAVRDLFEKHKKNAPGYENAQLVYI